MSTAHSRFAPSSAERRIHCPPSLLFEEQFDDVQTAFAAEGIAGHSLAEHMIRLYLQQPTEFPESIYYTDELLDAVTEYVAYAISQIDKAQEICKRPLISVEQRLDISEYVEDCFGTADMIVVTDNIAHIIDLKLGKGLKVYANGNPQLMMYGLGVLKMVGSCYDIRKLRLTIFQPRLNNFSNWYITPGYLKHWGDSVLRPAAEKAFAGMGDFKAGSWCRFCKARKQCLTRAKLTLEKSDKNSLSPKSTVQY